MALQSIYYMLDNWDLNENSYENVEKAFKQRGYDINNEFFNHLLVLHNIYQRIKEKYNDEDKFKQFNISMQKRIANSNRPSGEIFRSFYDTFMATISSLNEILNRKKIISNKLNIIPHLIKYIMQYEYYIIGELEKTISNDSSILNILISPNGKLIYGTYNSKIYKKIDLKTGETKVWDNPTILTNIRVLSDNRIVAFDEQGKITIWENEKIQRVIPSPTHEKEKIYISILILPNDNILCGDINGNLGLWDSKTGANIFYIKAHTDPIKDLLLLDNNTVASASEDQLIKIWNLTTGKLIKKLEGHKGPLNRLGLLSDGRIVSTSGDDEDAIIWKNYEVQHIIPKSGGLLAISGDKIILNSSVDYSINVFNSKGESLLKLVGHKGLINVIKIMPDGRLISVSLDQTLRIWDLDTGNCDLIISNKGGYDKEGYPLAAISMAFWNEKIITDLGNNIQIWR